MTSLQCWVAPPAGPASISEYAATPLASIQQTDPSKPKKSPRFLTSIVRSIRNLLKPKKAPEISTPFNFVHCRHAGVDPATKEIIDLPVDSMYLVSLDHLDSVSHLPSKIHPKVSDTRRASAPPQKPHSLVYEVRVSRKSVCADDLNKQESNPQRSTIQSNQGDKTHQRNSTHRPSLQLPRNRKKTSQLIPLGQNLEISPPFNPMHTAHIAFSKDGALIAMPQSWRRSLAFES
ncbi:hypothetical protein K493DRAFT_339828 [Basidiobolus meristosporus CBS 931.73]|uniref:CRIB domain-containing protein n=1 Tax=Basidiobolus meristosporus CBS 931.73 TaxID=1314790 RepID=A0A1Y1XYB0_9FUNG|nr:hypothetical protein K493DRAFT_339828 [Basidiobolus meristosporus CBS 931.73]|eukprot:ORX90722.1 hypothetical protein K493DRAFT_339828 [Basidiobolus meristosporus CBS 931.73]